jgi:hypothetical protein
MDTKPDPNGRDIDLGLVLATTNYDTIAENALIRAGRLPDWGRPHVPAGMGASTIQPEGLLAGMPRYVPIIHLHGRAGWYRRKDPQMQVYEDDIRRHQAGFGVPIVMLPDPEKLYDTDDVIDGLWGQFREALTRAKRVLVLGHSLNDRVLVQTLARDVHSQVPIGVTVLPDPVNKNAPDASAGHVVQMIHTQLPQATVVPLRFGPGMGQGVNPLKEWVDRT